jgi:hypothetical protein
MISKSRRKSGFWTKKENQREFLLKIAKKYEINTPDEWGKLTLTNILKEGGHGLLFMNDSSLLRSLQAVFPGSKKNYIFIFF